MKTIKKYILPIIIILGFLSMIYFPISQAMGEKITLIAITFAAVVYFFQLMSMNAQKNISEESFKNQEKILKEQKDIANKQYSFNIFTLRMNLRNELQRNFTLLLSANNY